MTKTKINKEDIEKLIHSNQRLCMLLGYCSAFIFGMEESPYFDECDREKLIWLKSAIENVVYLDKPFPPAP